MPVPRADRGDALSSSILTLVICAYQNSISSHEDKGITDTMIDDKNMQTCQTERERDMVV